MQTENKLHDIRHSLAHLLAIAVLKYDPKAKLAIGPVIDNGFYYDFLLDKPISETDLQGLEDEMNKLILKKLDFTGKEISKDDALKHFAGQPFKTELIEEFGKDGLKLTTYTTGDFTDLCRGGHVMNTSEIPTQSFKIDKLAGAYWRGDEKNPQLTRIYGLAFETKEKLDEYILMQEEAAKRDHRKLGKELDIFSFDDDVGPGLPLWLPNGTIIREELEKLAKETEGEQDYLRVSTPHIAKESMYLTSGHLPYYKESMYPPMEYEGTKYYLKAMNCPHHHKIFAARPRSHKELPMRLAEYGTVYRHEKSGELFGLMRVRSLAMNDAHIYCTKEQFREEFEKVNEMYLRYFKIFGIDKYVMRFSTHDPRKLGQKYVDEPALWLETEDMVRNVLIDAKIPYKEVADEGAFYGPKIDVEIFSAIGREFTLATNQVDFAVPRRFGLTFKNKEGKDETPLVIHRAPLGTHERFIGFLIEHYAGAFPTWLSPVQVVIVPVSEKFSEYSKDIYKKLKTAGVRVQLDDDNETLGKRIRNNKVKKVPYMVVIGAKEVEAQTITAESRDRGQIKDLKIDDFVKMLKEEISERK
jgi:threonyl-tRNA synthetase